MLVVLDACVLYPPSLRDLLRALVAIDAFDVAWTEEILHELGSTLFVSRKVSTAASGA